MSMFLGFFPGTSIVGLTCACVCPTSSSVELRWMDEITDPFALANGDCVIDSVRGVIMVDGVDTLTKARGALKWDALLGTVPSEATRLGS